MDLEATIVERLQNLRQWQMEQQERLLRQQQMQREMLSQKQDCIYKALELSIQDLNESNQCNDNIPDIEKNMETDLPDAAVIHNLLHNDDNCMKTTDSYSSGIGSDNISPERLISDQQLCTQVHTPIKDLANNIKHAQEKLMNKATHNIKHCMDFASTPENQEKEVTKFLMDGIAPLPKEKCKINYISIDDVPIPSPRKDFNTLLEERLKICEGTPNEGILDSKVIIKKPFLRKGEGLSRFQKPNRVLKSCTSKMRPRSSSLSANAGSALKHNKNIENKHKALVQTPKISQSKKGATTMTSNQHLSLKNIPLPKMKSRSKSESTFSSTQFEDHTNQSKDEPELNTSDFRSKTQKEIEEVRIFEMMEEKAENSSFCSTSSAAVAFLQQSTPFKMNTTGMKNKELLERISQYGILNKKQFNEGGPQSPNTKSKNFNWVSTHKKNSPSSVLTNKRSNMHIGMKTLQVPEEHNKANRSTKVHTLPRNQIGYMRNKENSYIPNSVNDNEVDVSLHVRFAEYNEYKTIGLTDTSSVSNESETRNCFEDDQVWIDFTNSESSDTETLTPKTGSPEVVSEKQICNQEPKSVQCIVPEGLNYKPKSPTILDFAREKGLLQDAYHICDGSECSDVIDQFSDDDAGEELASLDQYDRNDSPFQTNADCHKNDSLNNCIKSDTRKSTECLNVYRDQVDIQDEQNKDIREKEAGTIFHSELLKNRLLDLEREIDIFRKENAALSLQRKKLQEDYAKVQKEYVEKEKKLEESRKQAEDHLQEERKKLAREKSALRTRLRDSQEKAQQSKLQREEMQIMKEELVKLQHDMDVKESERNAIQSRQKCQIRILKTENLKLKQEIQELKNSKKNNIKNKGKFGIQSNAKAIHMINRRLELKTKETFKAAQTSSSDSEQNVIEPMIKATAKLDSENVDSKEPDDAKNDYEQNSNKFDVYQTLQKSHETMTNVTKKRILYEDLLKEATSNLTETNERSEASENSSTSKSETDDQTMTFNRKKDKENNHCDNPKDSDFVDIQDTQYVPFIPPEKITLETNNPKFSAKMPEKSPSSKSTALPSQNYSKCEFSDGHIEYWFANGNVQKIYPDQGLTRTIYYNGDVREINEDGIVKYFYASTRTWHTTMPDGLEILEFPDGQVERRSNGTVEVSFPDGSIRILQSNGTEKWALVDGTIVETFTNGEKILTLPNGQREIHTKAHKRREYPDGTVKLVYPDGTQETRYSNGRIRLKDKNGTLLMDSYQ